MLTPKATATLGWFVCVAACSSTSEEAAAPNRARTGGSASAGGAASVGGASGSTTSGAGPASAGSATSAGQGGSANGGGSAAGGLAGSAGTGGGEPTCEGELCPADITFFAFGDCQYGGGPDKDKNHLQITAMNGFAGTPWPDGMPSAGTPVATPRGVMMAGDITNSGRDGRPGDEGANQLGRFLSDYGLTGKEGLLRYPIYEGYGNHDYDPLEGTTGWRQYYKDPITPGVQAVIDRNADRIGLTEVASEGGHYSWDWGGIHFVNANLFPGNEPSLGEEHGFLRAPYHSLDFLKKDLETHVGRSCRPVIVMSHYGFENTPGWWTEEQKQKFMDIGKDYNVIAYIHGHNHDTSLYQWQGMDTFNVGSPYYDTATNPDGLGHFSVFRIHGDTFEAADVAWDPAVSPTRAQFVTPTEASPNMGWRLSKKINRACSE